MQTERVTRSRARTMAGTGDTPALTALPAKTPATRATTRRRGAAAATAPPAAGAPASTAEEVQPVVLFDVTNDQDGAVPAAVVPVPAGEEPEAAPAPAAEASADAAAPAAEPSADEPPATPAHSASPAPAAPSATPTGLGLSNLLPQSPLAATLPAATPAATPLGGAPADGGRVAQALHAAVEALGGTAASPTASSPAAAASPTAAGPAPQAESLVFRGFGSPLKQEADSPEAEPVSIEAAVRPAGEPAAAPSPAQGLDFQIAEREVTLEEMMGTPFPSDGAKTPEGPTPTLQAPPASAAPTGTTPVVVRTAAKVHPLTPSRQVVLEAEEQDYVMHVEGEQPAIEEASDDEMAAAEQPSPSPAAAPGPAVAAAPRVQSKVVVPSPHTYDPRSLRQLRREVADRLAAKQAGAPAGLHDEDWEEEEEEEEGGFIAAAPGGDELADALGGLTLETGAHGPLRGLPTPVGTHIRFDDDGEGAESPRQRMYLRGLPVPEGTHIRFDDA